MSLSVSLSLTSAPSGGGEDLGLGLGLALLELAIAASAGPTDSLHFRRAESLLACGLTPDELAELTARHYQRHQRERDRDVVPAAATHSMSEVGPREHGGTPLPTAQHHRRVDKQQQPGDEPAAETEEQS